MVVEIIKGREWVKRAMRATQGKFGKTTVLTDKTFLQLLIAKHSVIEEFEIWVDAVVTERVHTHLVRHKEIGKYVATSRPDLNPNQVINGLRQISLRINAKRLIEIMEQRLCANAWYETREFFGNLKRMILFHLDQTLASCLEPPCIKLGYCPETSRTCGLTKSKFFESERTLWLEKIRGMG